MLRNAIVAIGALCLILAVDAFLTGGIEPGWVLLIWGTVLAGGVLVERFRYKRLQRRLPGPGWERTTERFVDEETGKMVTVYIQPESGERVYVRD